MTRLFCEAVPAWTVGKGDSVYLYENGKWELHPVFWYVRGTSEDYTTLLYDDDHESTRHDLNETLLILPRLERRPVCDHCGKVIEHRGYMQTIGGKHYCDSECAWCDGWTFCEVCNTWVPDYEADHLLDSWDQDICEDCLSHLEQDANARAIYCDVFGSYVTHKFCCGCSEKHHANCGRGM